MKVTLEFNYPEDEDNMRKFVNSVSGKEWIDLTREEFAEILCDDKWMGRPELMLLQAQLKLKEKNCG